MKEKTAAAKVALSIKCKSVKEIYPARRRRQPQAGTHAHTHTHNQAPTHTLATVATSRQKQIGNFFYKNIF